MNMHQHGPPSVISVMLAVTDAPAAIAKARPIIGGFSNRVETTPLGGIGLRTT